MRGLVEPQQQRDSAVAVASKEPSIAREALGGGQRHATLHARAFTELVTVEEGDHLVVEREEMVRRHTKLDSKGTSLNLSESSPYMIVWP